MSEEHVLICVAWPYANGPLHLGHVAGCYLPPDIQARFERAKGNRVLMVSGSDEHGTPITVTAEQNGITPQQVVDEYHALNSQALLDLGCSWQPNIDSRGIEYGGALFNRTSDPRHKKMVQENFLQLMSAGLFETKTMEQYYEIHQDGGGRFLPDRYVEGTCPSCSEDGARGDQCDSCGAT
jgi:methionyl-tRNA synthetase